MRRFYVCTKNISGVHNKIKEKTLRSSITFWIGTNKGEESISTITITVFVTHIFVGTVQKSILFDAYTVPIFNTFMKHDILFFRTNIISPWCKYNKPRRIIQNKRKGLVFLLTWEISVASHSKIRPLALIITLYFVIHIHFLTTERA